MSVSELGVVKIIPIWICTDLSDTHIVFRSLMGAEDHIDGPGFYVVRNGVTELPVRRQCVTNYSAQFFVSHYLCCIFKCILRKHSLIKL